MKKGISLFLSALIGAACFGTAACGGKDPYDGLNETAAIYAEHAVTLNESVKEKYWIEEALFMYHYYPNETNSGNLSTAYLWPYTEAVAANYKISTLTDALCGKTEEYYRNTLSGFEYYRGFRTDYTVYCSSRSTTIGMAGGDFYYDDNVWVSREFLNAYETLGDESYLTTAIGVAEFVWSGWADDDLGGIYWCEQKKTSRNTCSNAPASLLFARLYEVTGEESWLDRAKQVYLWTYETLMDPSDGVYWDNITNEGEISTAKYTYNTGSMISAGIKLYEITGEEDYLSQAKFSAAGAYSYWFVARDGYDFRVITSNNPWFNVLLFEGWIELYRYDKETTLVYIEAYEANLNHAYEMVSDGLMPSDWVNGWSTDDEGNAVISSANVLDMAANAENFATLAYFYQFVKEDL